MPTNNGIYQYPFDPTGLASTNKITGEQHTVNALNGYRDYQLIIPNAAPMFEQGLKVRYVDPNNAANNRPLTFGVDYVLTHRFVTASLACAKPIFGSILLLDTALEGVVVLDTYQTIGGEWTLEINKIAEILANLTHNPRLTSWESIVDIPYYFPVQDHDWRIEDMVGASDMVASIYGIEQAIRQSGAGSINTHIQDRDNPHGVTKAQVGLDKVMNYAMATKAIAEAGTSVSYYMSPLRTKELITKEMAEVRAHVAIISGNPHGTTADMLNAYTKPQVDQLLEDLRNSGLVASDAIRFNGRTDVEYRDWVLSFGVDDAQKFAGRTWDEAYDEMRSGIPVANITGAYSSAQIDNLLDDKLGKTEKAADSTRFDGKTYQQAYDDFRTGIPVANVTGAYSSTQVDNLLADKLGKTETAANSERFDGKTYQEAYDDIRSAIPVANVTGAYSSAQVDNLLANKLGKTEKAADSTRFNGKTYQQAFNEFRTDIPVINVTGAVSQNQMDTALLEKLGRNETATDTAKFDDKGPAEFKAWVLEGTAANSNKIFNMDQAQAVDWIQSVAGGASHAQTYRYPPFLESASHTNVWSYIGTYTASADQNMGSWSILVEGGDTPTVHAGGLYNLTASHLTDDLNSIEIKVKAMNTAEDDGVKFGYVKEVDGADTHYKFYFQTKPNPLGIDINRLSSGNGALPIPDNAVQSMTEPTGIQYVEITRAGAGGGGAETFVYERPVAIGTDSFQVVAILDSDNTKVHEVSGEIVLFQTTSQSAYNDGVSLKYRLMRRPGLSPLFNYTTNGGTVAELRAVTDSSNKVYLILRSLPQGYNKAINYVQSKIGTVQVAKTSTEFTVPTDTTTTVPNTKAGREQNAGTLNAQAVRSINYENLGGAGITSLIQVLVRDPDSTVSAPIWYDALNYFSISRGAYALTLVNETATNLDYMVIVRP